jgi:hypothetical protein
VGLTEKAIEAGVDAAIKAREERDKRRKITDEATIRVCIRVDCLVEDASFAPPLDVFVNGVRKPQGINVAGSEKRNECALWLTLGVDADGVRPLVVRLVPVDGAGAHFKTGESASMRLEPAFYRNEVEKVGRDFADPELKRSDTPPHTIRVRIEPRRAGLFKTRKATDIPRDWRA